MLLRWRNHAGILNPAWQISIVRNYTCSCSFQKKEQQKFLEKRTAKVLFRKKNSKSSFQKKEVQKYYKFYLPKTFLNPIFAPTSLHSIFAPIFLHPIFAPTFFNLFAVLFFKKNFCYSLVDFKKIYGKIFSKKNLTYY